MRTPNQNPGPLPSQLKHLVVEMFRPDIPEPDQIDDQAPLLSGSLGLDSLDALELAMAVEERFGISIGSRQESLSAFASIASLSAFIQARAGTNPAFLHPPVTSQLSRSA